jgi:hypothetical protein
MVNHTIQKLALISLLSLSVSAFAAEKQGSYGGIELGYLGLQNEAQASANDLVRAFGGSATVNSDSGMAVGRLFGGYNFNENIGIELGAYRTSDFDQTASGTTSGGAYTARATLYNYGVDGSFLIRPNISTGLNNLFVRFGGHWSETNADASFAGSVAGTAWAYQRGTGWLAGLGYDADVSKDVSVRISWTHRDRIAGSDYYANIGMIGAKFNF